MHCSMHLHVFHIAAQARSGSAGLFSNRSASMKATPALQSVSGRLHHPSMGTWRRRLPRPLPCYKFSNCISVKRVHLGIQCTPPGKSSPCSDDDSEHAASYALIAR